MSYRQLPTENSGAQLVKRISRGMRTNLLDYAGGALSSACSRSAALRCDPTARLQQYAADQQATAVYRNGHRKWVTHADVMGTAARTVYPVRGLPRACYRGSMLLSTFEGLTAQLSCAYS